MVPRLLVLTGVDPVRTCPPGTMARPAAQEVGVRILHVVTRLGLGGAERIAENLASEMASRGNEVAVVSVAATRDPRIADQLHENLGQRGVAVLGGSTFSSAKPAVFTGALALSRTVERFRPDLVHLHTEIPELTWALTDMASGRARRLPVVRTVHNTVLWGGWGALGRFAERRLDRARAAAVSDAARDSFVAWRTAAGRDPGDPVVIYNGVDESGLGDPPPPRTEPPLLCFAGRFEPQKGLDVLADALGLLTEADPPFRLAIYGSGSLDDEAARAAAAWPDRVTVGPPVPELRSHLGSFDAILLPSRFEGLSVLALEALCTGVPVLATSAKGLDEVFPAGYPRRCPPDDPAAYADLIRNFLAARGEWREKALRAREEARRRFSIETMVAAYERLYAETVGAGPVA